MILASFKDDLSAFLKSYAFYICLAIIAIIIFVILFVFLIPAIKRKKNHTSTLPVFPVDEWIIALGGKENISNVFAASSRLSLTLNDPSLMQQDKLKQLGVSNIIVMSTKVILVIEDKAEQIKKELDKSL